MPEAKELCYSAHGTNYPGIGLWLTGANFCLSPDSEPSASRLAELTEYIKKNKIKYIYFEENASQFGFYIS